MSAATLHSAVLELAPNQIDPVINIRALLSNLMPAGTRERGDPPIVSQSSQRRNVVRSSFSFRDSFKSSGRIFTRSDARRILYSLTEETDIR